MAAPPSHFCLCRTAMTKPTRFSTTRERVPRGLAASTVPTARAEYPPLPPTKRSRTMRIELDRRRLLLAMAAAAGTASVPSALRAAMGPNDKFDLLVKGGELLDPSRGFRGTRDIGIRNGVIEAVEASIPVERALKVLNVPGRLATPGLIDLHAHT